ncbi:MAG TPA: hypothetical protein VL020_04955 [Pseudomonadales bacterium]|nr:hypothetical protein [Pseudomonadales bacterium]
MSNQYEDKEPRDAVTKIVTGGVAQYYELEDGVHTEMAMSPPFPARWNGDLIKEIDELVTLITQKQLEARTKGIIEALEGVNQQHYGYKGELVIDTYLSLKDRLRPKPEEPGYSLPVSEAIEFYKAELTKQKGK